MTKDWTGGFNGVFKTLGASNHGEGERERNDYYATHPIALEMFAPHFPIARKVGEPSCGEGHLSRWLKAHGHGVLSTDLIDRGYGIGGINFFEVGNPDMFENTEGNRLLTEWCLKDNASQPFDILTNPPYKFATEYVLHALELIPEKGHVIMFLKTTFLEGMERKERIFDTNPPVAVFQFSHRVLCAKNGDFAKMPKNGSAVAYAMYVWAKRNKGMRTELKWI